MVLSSIVFAAFALRALIALRNATRITACCPSCDGQGDAPGVYSRHNPTGLVHCRACDGAGEVDHSHWDGDVAVARRAARTATPAAHVAAAALEARLSRIAVSTLAARRAPTLSPNVLDAARELGVQLDPATDPRTAGWMLAVELMARPRTDADRYERAAAVGLARALDAGDVAAAEDRALWIVRPAVAMDAALAFVRRSQGRHAECCACRKLVRSVDSEHMCAPCGAEMREVADARARADMAWLDSSTPWSHAWELVDSLSAVA